MRAPSIGRAIFLGWVAAELIAYAVFFSLFSLSAGILFGAGSIALGLLTIRAVGRRVARGAAAELMKAAENRSLGSLPYALLGSVLLLLPGFLSNLAGLVLVLLGSRFFWGRAVSPAQERTRAQEVELEPHEWSRLPDDNTRR